MHFAETLKVGDKVLIFGRNSRYHVGTVERLTKTLVIVDGAKFRKRDGCEPGDDWRGSSIHTFCQDRLDAQERERTRTRLAYQLRDTRWREVSLDKLVQIAAILEGEE